MTTLLSTGSMDSSLAQSWCICNNTLMLTDGRSNPRFFLGNTTDGFITAIPVPTTGLTAASGATPGLTGTYYYWYSYKITASNWRSNLSPSASITVTNTAVSISALTLSSHPQVDAIEIWRSKDGEAIPYLVTSVANTGVPTYTDSASDDTLVTQFGFMDGGSLVQPYGHPLCWTTCEEWGGRIFAGGTELYNAGTANITTGSATVTLSAAATRLNQAMIGMYFSVADGSYYQIANIVGQVLTLSGNIIEATNTSAPYKIFGPSTEWFFSYIDDNLVSHPYAFPFTYTRRSYYVASNKANGERVTGVAKLGGSLLLGLTNKSIYSIEGERPETYMARCIIPGHGNYSSQSFCTGPNDTVLVFDPQLKTILQIYGSKDYEDLLKNSISKYMRNEDANNFNLYMDSKAILRYFPRTDSAYLWRASYGSIDLDTCIKYKFSNKTASIINRTKDFPMCVLVCHYDGQWRMFSGTAGGKILEEEVGYSENGTAIQSTLRTGFISFEEGEIHQAKFLKVDFDKTTARTGTINYYIDNDYTTAVESMTVNFDAEPPLIVPIPARCRSIAVEIVSSSAIEQLRINSITVVSEDQNNMR